MDVNPQDIGHKVLGPDGEPYRRHDQFAIPHVATFQFMLGSAWRTYYHDRWDEAMRHSREDALAMYRDTYLRALVQERIMATCSLNHHIEIDNSQDRTAKAVCDGLNIIVKNSWRLQTMKRYLLEAIWYGRYAAQVRYVWKELDLPAIKTMPQTGVAPAAITTQFQKRRALTIGRHFPVNGDKIGHTYDHRPYLLVNASIDFEREMPGAKTLWTTLHKAVILEGQYRVPFIIHKHEISDQDFFEAEQAEGAHGVGLRSVLYWFWWLKSEWLSNICDWMERAGLGVRIWYYQGGNEASRAEVEEVARKNLRRTNILVPRYGNDASAEGFKWEDVATGGSELLLKLQKYLDEAMERYVVGQSLSANADGGGLGGSGVADLHASTKAKLVAFDARNLADTFTEDWLTTVLKWTYREYADLPARWVFDVDAHNPKDKLEAVYKAFSMGVSFREDDVRALAGLEPPREGDKIVSEAKQLAAQTQAQGGGMPGEGGQQGGDLTLDQLLNQMDATGELPPSAGANPNATGLPPAPGTNNPKPHMVQRFLATGAPPVAEPHPIHNFITDYSSGRRSVDRYSRLDYEGDEWQQFKGPNEGKGWRNSRTGEVRYQEQRPSDGGGSEEKGSEEKGGGKDDGGEAEPAPQQNLLVNAATGLMSRGLDPQTTQGLLHKMVKSGAIDQDGRVLNRDLAAQLVNQAISSTMQAKINETQSPKTKKPAKGAAVDSKETIKKLASLRKIENVNSTSFEEIDALMTSLSKLPRRNLAKAAKLADVIVGSGESKGKIIKEIANSIKNRKANIGRTSYGSEQYSRSTTLAVSELFERLRRTGGPKAKELAKSLMEIFNKFPDFKNRVSDADWNLLKRWAK